MARNDIGRAPGRKQSKAAGFAEPRRATRQVEPAEAERACSSHVELFDFAPIGYFALGVDGRIQDANLAAAELTGVDRSRLIGRGFAELFREEQRDGCRALIDAVLLGEEGHSREATLVAPGREGREVRLTASWVERHPASVLVFAEDVTPRRRAEAALDEACRHKDEFLATLSHELRNPLAPIRNSVFVLERSGVVQEQGKRALCVIDRQVSHLARIVDDLLDVTRIERGSIQLKRDRLDWLALVRETIDDHRPAFDASGVELTGPTADEPVWVNGDRTRLAQVLGNLLANALKFTPEGGRVEVELRREAKSATLSVRDTGVGIPVGMCSLLFTPFRQAPQTLDRSRGGLGLGLAMVRGLVELHEGDVRAASAGPGKGAEFPVRLPVTRSPASLPPPPPAPRQPRRVLVIEDNVDAADTLRDVLSLEGHQVAVAYDGPTGLSLAQRFRPEIVICDIGLPAMDGYAVARALRSDETLRPAYLVALSGYALPHDVREAMDAGFDGVSAPLI